VPEEERMGLESHECVSDEAFPIAAWGTDRLPMTKPVSFFSTCPTCGRQQLQLAYTRRALISLLRNGNIIDAYCLACDAVWPVNAEERNLVVAAIAAGKLAPKQHRG